MNTYVYVHNNPIVFVDPWGLKVEICCRRLNIGIGPFQFGGYVGRHCYVKTEDGTFGLYPSNEPALRYRTTQEIPVALVKNARLKRGNPAKTSWSASRNTKITIQ